MSLFTNNCFSKQNFKKTLIFNSLSDTVDYFCIILFSSWDKNMVCFIKTIWKWECVTMCNYPGKVRGNIFMEILRRWPLSIWKMIVALCSTQWISHNILVDMWQENCYCLEWNKIRSFRSRVPLEYIGVPNLG